MVWRQLSKNRAPLALILAWCLLVGAMAALRHLAFNSTAYDLGIFDQVVWNTTHGQWFANTIMRDSPSHLGHHFSPILLAFVPLYWIWANPLVLLAAQTLLVGLAGLPIFWIARDRLGSARLGMVALGAYLLQPATAYICLYDFHEVSAAVPLLALALYFTHARRYRALLVTLGLLLLVKEDMGLVCAALGVYIGLGQRQWRWGALVITVGLAWTILMIEAVIPAFHPSGQYYFTNLYPGLGAAPGEIARSFLVQPQKVWENLIMPHKLEYVLQILLPLGGLSLGGLPLLVVTVPGMLLPLLSNMLPVQLIKYQYSATVAPVLVVAAILGWASLICRFPQHRLTISRGLVGYLLGASLLGAYLYGPLPLASRFDPSQYQQQPRFDTLRQMLGMIPAGASVVAQCNVVPHLSRRTDVYQFYYRDTNLPPDYYLLDALWRGCSFWFADNDRVLGQILADPTYRTIWEQDGYLLIRPEPWAIGRAIGATFDEQVEVEGATLPETAVPAGKDIKVDLYWRAKRALDTDYSLLLYVQDVDGRRWGQWHSYPVGGHWLATEWPADQLLRGQRQVPLDPATPPGEYIMMAELYQLPEMPPPKVTGPPGVVVGNAVVLGRVRVAE